MSWKKLLAFILAIIAIGGSALFSAMAGGVIVYRLMSQQQAVALPTVTTEGPTDCTALVMAVSTSVVFTTRVLELLVAGTASTVVWVAVGSAAACCWLINR